METTYAGLPHDRKNRFNVTYVRLNLALNKDCTAICGHIRKNNSHVTYVAGDLKRFHMLRNIWKNVKRT